MLPTGSITWTTSSRLTKTSAKLLWPKPLTEMTVVKLSYQLKLTNHTILCKVIECQIKVGSHCKSDQLQGERRKLTARYEALMIV